MAIKLPEKEAITSMIVKRFTAIAVLASLIAVASPSWAASRSVSVNVRCFIPERLEFNSAKVASIIHKEASPMDLSMNGKRVDYQGGATSTAFDLDESIVRSAAGYRKIVTMTAL
jgi:hypothetical protein